MTLSRGLADRDGCESGPSRRLPGAWASLDECIYLMVHAFCGMGKGVLSGVMGGLGGLI